MQKEYLSLLIEVIEMKELLHTDPELIRLSIPFSQEELSKLESSLMENGTTIKKDIILKTGRKTDINPVRI